MPPVHEFLPVSVLPFWDSPSRDGKRVDGLHHAALAALGLDLQGFFGVHVLAPISFHARPRRLLP
jgi:hypothetical protein